MFHFTIRDVLWLTVVVALAVGCFMQRVELTRTTVRHQREMYRIQVKLAEQELRAAWLEVDRIPARVFAGRTDRQSPPENR